MDLIATMPKYFYCVIMLFDGRTWSFQTFDRTGTKVNSGTGYSDLNLAFAQAQIFTETKAGEHPHEIFVTVSLPRPPKKGEN